MKQLKHLTDDELTSHIEYLLDQLEKEINTISNELGELVSENFLCHHNLKDLVFGISAHIFAESFEHYPEDTKAIMFLAMSLESVALDIEATDDNNLSAISNHAS